MIQIVDIDSVRASTYNPRKADPKRLDMIELSLRKLGFVLPIYTDKTGEILSGHQRHFVAKRMGVKKIPVEIIEKDLPLNKRKSYNVAFNRGTNDMKQSDTTQSIKERFSGYDIEKLAAGIPDIDIDSAEFFPCAAAKFVSMDKIVKMNIDRFENYSKALANTLSKIGVKMPLVVDEKLYIVNGLGRAFNAAEKKEKVIKAVILDDKRAEFANVMLNFVSMDFDIGSRYADELRYNSFMRPRNTRGYGDKSGFGNGFYKGIFPKEKGINLNPLRGEHLEKWIERYGTSTVDFGAGKLSNTRILREAGIKVAAFEPYFVASGNEPSKKASLEIIEKFLDDVESGTKYDSVFISSVFNSVPFMQDRKYIARICSALCSENTRLVCWAQSTSASQNMKVRGAAVLSKAGANGLTMPLDYEPNVALGDLSDKVKVQKFHSKSEFVEIFSPCFAKIKRLEVIDSFLYLEAQNPILDVAALKEAIEFEFDLPYPDGTKMGMVERAKEAFGKRLGIDLH